MRVITISIGVAVALYLLHRIALFEARGWIFYKTRPPRVRTLSLLEELVDPRVEYTVENSRPRPYGAIGQKRAMATVKTMNLSEFEGRTYGPAPWRVAVDAVSDFVDLTGDDEPRWKEHAPPGFAAAALFSVAPELLAELYDRSVIHGEQTFTWERPIEVGALLDVSGEVTKVRERGGVHFVTFEMIATADDGQVLSGRSLFLASGEALAAGEPEFERPEPPHSYHGETQAGQVSASRADLVRYASATRDWNPVHWDHRAGLAAGFPGVVVHGLLQAGWALRVASAGVAGDRPFAGARFRFRNALLPARPVDVVVHGAAPLEVTLRDEDSEYLTATMEPADG